MSAQLAVEVDEVGLDRALLHEQLGRGQTLQRRDRDRGSLRHPLPRPDPAPDIPNAPNTTLMVEDQAQSVGTRLSPGIWQGVRLKPHTCSKGTKRFWCDLVTGLGAIELQRLSPAQLNAFYRDLLTRGGRNTPGGLAPKTVRYIHSILHRALRDAVRWGSWSATWLTRPTRPSRGRPRCRCGAPISFGPSSTTSRPTASVRRGRWR